VGVTKGLAVTLKKKKKKKKKRIGNLFVEIITMEAGYIRYKTQFNLKAAINEYSNYRFINHMSCHKNTHLLS